MGDFGDWFSFFLTLPCLNPLNPCHVRAVWATVCMKFIMCKTALAETWQTCSWLLPQWNALPRMSVKWAHFSNFNPGKWNQLLCRLIKMQPKHCKTLSTSFLWLYSCGTALPASNMKLESKSVLGSVYGESFRIFDLISHGQTSKAREPWYAGVSIWGVCQLYWERIVIRETDTSQTVVDV